MPVPWRQVQTRWRFFDRSWKRVSRLATVVKAVVTLALPTESSVTKGLCFTPTALQNKTSALNAPLTDITTSTPVSSALTLWIVAQLPTGALLASATSTLEERPSDPWNERDHKLSSFEFSRLSTLPSTEQPHPQRFPSFTADHSFLSGTKKKLLLIPGWSCKSSLIDQFVVRAAFELQCSFTTAFPKLRVAWPCATARVTKQRSNEAPSATIAKLHHNWALSATSVHRMVAITVRAWSHCGMFFDYDRPRSQRTWSQKPAARSHYIFCFSLKRTRCSCSLYLKVLCVPFCLTFFSLITAPLRVRCPSFSLSLSLFRSPSLSPSGSLLLSLSLSLSLSLTRSGSRSLSFAVSHSLLLAVSHSLSLIASHSLSLVVSHSLSLVASHSLSLIASHSLSLVVSHSLSLAISHSFSLAICHSLSLQLCVRLSLSLISIQDIPCVSKHDVNLPLIIASKKTEWLCSWANDLWRSPEKVLRFFLALHVPKKSHLQIISIV